MKTIRKFILIGILGLIVGFTSVYFLRGQFINLGIENSCSESASNSDSLKQLVKGEMAAFIVSSNPQHVGDLSFSNENGEPVRISDFKGSTVLLNLWATWCAPCREEMPHLDVLQENLGDEKFKVVAVSVDSGSTDKSKAFLKEIGVNHLEFWSDSSMKILTDLRQIGRAPGLPTTLLINESNCEVGALFGPANWASDDAKQLINSVVVEKQDI